MVVNDTEVKATDEDVMKEFVAKIDNGQSKFRIGQIVTASISSADEDGIQILLPFSKKEVKLDKADLDCEEYSKESYNAKVGEEIKLMVVELKPSLKLSEKQIRVAAEEEAAIAEIKDGKEFSIVCEGFNKGGLTGKLGSYSVFVPAKEIRTGFVKEMDKYVGKKLRLKSIEVKSEGRKKEIIASQRVILAEEKAAREAAKAAKEAAFFDSINVDDIVEGKVERATSFGAFVSVNGFDCLAHISDLSWTGVKSVTDVLEIGKKYQFKVLKIDEAEKKVSIGYKQLQPQPWELIEGKYNEGDVVKGKVVRIVPFGAFVEVEKGVDGLVHVSQISHEWLENPTSALTIGNEVEAKVMAVDVANKKMTLSIKALTPEPETAKKPARRAEKAEDADEEVESKPRKQRSKRVEKSDDEYSEWTDNSSSGASIAEMLKLAGMKND